MSTVRVATVSPSAARSTADAPAGPSSTATWLTLGCTRNVAAELSAAWLAGARPPTTAMTQHAVSTTRRSTVRRYCKVSWHDRRVTRLADAHVVITGGSSGIGLETARRAVARGARVSLIARDEGRLAAAASEVGATATASADVARPELPRARDRRSRAAGRSVRRADHGGWFVASGVLRAARRRGVPRARWRSTTSARCTQSAPSCRR